MEKSQKRRCLFSGRTICRTWPFLQFLVFMHILVFSNYSGNFFIKRSAAFHNWEGGGAKVRDWQRWGRTLFQILIDSIYQHKEKTKEVQGEGKKGFSCPWTRCKYERLNDPHLYISHSVSVARAVIQTVSPLNRSWSKFSLEVLLVTDPPRSNPIRLKNPHLYQPKSLYCNNFILYYY